MTKVSFDISSAMLDSNTQKALKPDENGIYHDFPFLVLGKVSANNKDYEVSSMVDAISNPRSMFYKKLVSGQLEGEWWHPLTGNDESALSRIVVIDRSNVSHHIHRVYTGKPTEKGHIVVYGDFEPAGPYGPHLKESLENPRINTAFSLRSLVSTISEKDGIVKQRVIVLVTIDAVDAPGYAEASKVHISTPGMEGSTFEIDIKKHAEFLRREIGVENLQDQQLCDMLERDKVTIRHNRYRVDVDQRVLKSATGNKNIFHELFRHE